MFQNKSMTDETYFHHHGEISVKVQIKYDIRDDKMQTECSKISHSCFSGASRRLKPAVCFADECEEVELQVQKVIQEMENILGEPLQSYF